MGTRGPKRKPAPIVAIEGNKGRRKPEYSAGPEPPVTDGTPQPPEYLGDLAKSFWRRMAAILIATNPALLTKADLPVFEQMCACWQRLCEISVKRTDSASIIEMKLQSALLRFSQRFGLTPADRAGLAVPDAAKNSEGAEFFKNG